MSGYDVIVAGIVLFLFLDNIENRVRISRLEEKVRKLILGG